MHKCKNTNVSILDKSSTAGSGVGLEIQDKDNGHRVGCWVGRMGGGGG